MKMVFQPLYKDAFAKEMRPAMQASLSPNNSEGEHITHTSFPITLAQASQMDLVPAPPRQDLQGR
jgi:hypothetical protein